MIFCQLGGVYLVYLASLLHNKEVGVLLAPPRTLYLHLAR